MEILIMQLNDFTLKFNIYISVSEAATLPSSVDFIW